MPVALKAKKKISQIDFSAVEALAEELQCDKLFAQILYNRGLVTKETCLEFLYPSEKDLNDPFSMLNMDVLVKRIFSAKENNQKVTVYGDYDVDGISATAILTSAFERLGIKTSYYIPDRHTEGYGLNENALNSIFEDGCDLVITVDCGIASVELIKKQMELGREIIVTDHHTIGQEIPPCLIVKPGQPGDNYKNTELCGAGIAFKIAQALLNDDAIEYIDYAAVATIADVVPLKGENRFLVKKGLEILNTSPRDCYKSLLESAGHQGEVNSQTIGFVIAPRLNAAGRMEKAEEAFELLKATGEDAKRIANTLSEYNLKRQDAEKRILENAENQIKEKMLIQKGKVLVLAGKGWDDGVIGICASRLCEKYKRPAIMFTIDENGMCKGSGRSIEGIDLYDMLSFASDILVQFGGHKMAAGMSVREERLDDLTARLNEYLLDFNQVIFYPVETYDAKAKIKEITVDFCKRLQLFQPCGSENPEITLRIDNCLAGGMKKIGNLKNHLKMYLQDDTAKADAIAFNYEKHNCDYFNLQQGSAIIKPEVNVWQNIENVSLKLSEFKEDENIKPRQKAEELTSIFYERLALPKTNKANVQVIEDSEELNYMISEWCDDDISGTLILCDHPEYANGCVSMLENEAPRCDISMGVPINKNCGYNSLVIGAEVDKIDFTPFKRVIIYDMLNFGFADSIFEKAPWLEIYALKGTFELFDSIYEEYKQINRENMMLAYRAICQNEGIFENAKSFLRLIADKKQIPMPITMVAVEVFKELQFINVTSGSEFKITVNREAEKRTLEESRYYMNLLKCVTNRNKV